MTAATAPPGATIISATKGGVRHRTILQSSVFPDLQLPASSSTSPSSSPRHTNGSSANGKHKSPPQIKRRSPQSSPQHQHAPDFQFHPQHRIFNNNKRLARTRSEWSVLAALGMTLVGLAVLCSFLLSTFSLVRSSSNDNHFDLPLTQALRGGSQPWSRRLVYLEQQPWTTTAAVFDSTSNTTRSAVDSSLTSDRTDGTMMYSVYSANRVEDDEDDWQPIDYASTHCQPMAEWQTMSFPTCNILHETPLHAVIPRPDQDEDSHADQLSILGQGWFRTTWRLDRTVFSNNDSSTESVVLKTLRIEREYKREYYELHRRDSVAMESLTHSPFVVNVHGACGNSAINELADFPFANVQSLEAFNRRLRGRDSDAVYNIKLRMAASIAVGVSDIHGLDFEDRASMVHYDLNPRNVALFRGGRPKLNDFNVAEFLHMDNRTYQTCGFPSRLHEPWWRAPEEMPVVNTDNTTTPVVRLIDEKVDVYALGNILFHTLTTHAPHGKMKPERMAQVREQVAAGIPPTLPPPYDNSTHPAAVAIRQAMAMCFEKKASKRATAQQVADLLMVALGNSIDVVVPEKPQDWSPPARGRYEDDSSDSEIVEAKG